MGQPNTDSDLEILVREFQASDLIDLHVRTAEFELFLSRDPQAGAPWASGGGMPAGTASPASPALPAAQAFASAANALAPAQARTAAVIPEGYVVVRAPYLGTFYRSPKPGEPNFVELGDTVEPGTDLCLVEVMKLFTAVRSQIRGLVREVYVSDGEMVTEGQPMFALEPMG